MTRFEMVKQGLCPIGHGPLDHCARCFDCSANWFIITPENGRYQSSGFGSNVEMVVFDSNDEIVWIDTIEYKRERF